ncbi:DUF924 family protein [Jeongeupia chitinilytica]|uniref:Membrane protein n=1 Tax=Jeongeupia chitinilytica TaxID=1041641 RepID=A0ABQ3H757_9NEIS|nr:DUF924 family protein [Jeongeupia chitinilytica]GHD68369.1 membrane protein [Jeongeupia chitinilytica]
MTSLIRRSSPEGQVKSGRLRAGRDTVATPDEVLAFWFGCPDDPDYRQPRAAWFRKDPVFDAAIRRRFLATVEAALAGHCDDWHTDARRTLALVIVLDQFPRNLFRGTARAFVGDTLACRIAHAAVDAGWHDALSPVEQLFLYLPFEHAESLADQERMLALTADWQGHDVLGDFHRYAVLHHEVIARFGRFPHRNDVLGRACTPDELDYLAQPGAGF